MELTSEQKNRAAGVLVGCAVGDVLGVPFEFKPPQHFTAADLPLGMPGGGPFNFRPGEWSDDTQMSLCIARAAHEGLDLSSHKGLERIAHAFHGWYKGGPRDVGGQVSSVLALAPKKTATGFTKRAAERFQNAPNNSAGNGSLMRTSPVALRHLGDSFKATQAARKVSALTHADPDCVEACILWTHAIRGAVLTGDYRAGMAEGLDKLGKVSQARWTALMVAAEGKFPFEFRNNGWVVHAFQAAWSAVVWSRDFESGITEAVGCGHDTDTVGAIAGALLGATYGVNAIPQEWRNQAHGWPVVTANDLVWIALEIAAHA